MGAKAWQDLDVFLFNQFEDLNLRQISSLLCLLNGVDTADHLIEKHAECPKISSVGMSLAFDDLRCHIIGRAGASISHIVVCRLQDLCQIELRELDVAFRV